ncbi:MAG: PEP-CTERM sorting domain-containing protein [Phycisphaerae bacterium]
MARTLTLTLACALLASPAAAAVIQLDMEGKSDIPGWNRLTSANGSITGLLEDDGVTATDLDVQGIGTVAFERNDWGPTNDVTTSGYFFPGHVHQSAFIWGGSGHGTYTLRFTSPSWYDFRITVLSDDLARGQTDVPCYFNVGGTWDDDAGEFVGGETIELVPRGGEVNPENISGVIDGVCGAWDGSQYVLDLQADTPGSDKDGFINAVVVEVTPVPEPATMGLLALGGLAFVRRRRTV